MKKILFIVFLIAFCAPLVAQETVDITLAWDQETSLDINLLKEVRIYNIATTPETLAATAVCVGDSPDVICPSEITFSITKGSSATWVARNYDGVQESENSNAVVYSPLPPPKNLSRQ